MGFWSAARAITRRELLEGLRDPSVFFSTIVMPTLFGPLLLWGSLQVMMLVEGDLEQAPPKVVILVEHEGQGGAPNERDEAAAQAQLVRALLRPPPPRAASAKPIDDERHRSAAEQAAADAAEEAEDAIDAEEAVAEEAVAEEAIAEEPVAEDPVERVDAKDTDGAEDTDHEANLTEEVEAAPAAAAPEAAPTEAEAAPPASIRPTPEQPAAPEGPARFTVLALPEAAALASGAGLGAPGDPPRQLVEALLNAGLIDLGLVLQVEGPRWAVELLHISTWSRSESARERATRSIRRLERKRKRSLLRAWGVNPADVRPLRSEQVNTAAPSDLLGHLLGLILPMVVMLNIIGGATAPCVEAIAGERERGSLETTLVSGAPRLAVLTGKAMTIMCWTVFTAFGSLFGLSLSVLHALASIGGSFAAKLVLPPAQAAMGLLVLVSALPLAPLLNLVVTLPTRTTRQAQTVAGFLVMPLMGLCFLSLDESRQLDGLTAAVPFLNVILSGRGALSGALELGPAGVAVGVNIGLTALLGGVCAWGFSGERLVLGLSAGPFQRWFRDRSSP